MSFIHVIEQLGANAALQQLNQTELMAMFQNASTDQRQLEALLKGNAEDLSHLLEVPVYRCVTEVPPAQEEQPDEEDEKPAQHSIRLQ